MNICPDYNCIQHLQKSRLNNHVKPLPGDRSSFKQRNSSTINTEQPQAAMKEQMAYQLQAKVMY